MKAVNAAVSTAIRSDHDITALPYLTAEWNFNRYVPVTATNIPDESVEGFDIEVYPIESIVEPLRPTKGMNKGIVQAATVADNYHTPRQPRYYVSSVDDKYKYWMSPYLSNSAGAISGVNPQIIYARTINVNKVSVTVENSWASPADYTVQITTNSGASWISIGTPVIQNDGKMEMYWNGAAWGASLPADLSIAPVTTPINGVRLVVTRMSGGRRIDGSPSVYKSPATNSWYNTTGANAYCSVIEISARLVANLTERVITVSDNFDAGEASHLTPIGTITTNTAEIELWNGDNWFSPQNTTSPYYGLVEANVEMNMSYIFDLPTGKHAVQQFKMYTNEWATNDDSATSVSLSDHSKFLQETKPRPCKYEYHTLSQIVYRLCDSVGFNNYVIFDNPNTVDYQIPVFYTDGEQTVWEIFDDLAQATQSLVYFDAYGRLNVKTRDDAFPRTTSPVWNLRGANSGTELADIVNLDQDDTFEANVIKVTYQSTKWADEVNGFPEFTTVWSPEGDTVLRSSPLLNQLNPGEQFLKIAPSEAQIWPYEGMCQINGETIRYEGKQFNYHINGSWNSRIINDQDEYDKYNAMTGSSGRFHNHFTGNLKIAERGMWNTDVETHRVDAGGYSVLRFGPDDVVSSNAGFTHNKQRSTVSLSGGGRLFGPQDFMTVTRGSQSDTGWRHYGTRIKFTSGNHVDQRAGLVFNCVGNRGGYYIELCPGSHIENKDRNQRKELGFYTITGVQPNGKIPAHGIDANIVEDRWHNIDVYFGWDNHRVMVWIDGKKFLDINVPGGQQFGPNGKWGMFIRGRTEAEFEYLYSIARVSEPIPLEDFSSLHKIEGYHDGMELKKEWVFKPKKKKKSNKPKHRKNFQFMDEFGPYVHEIREFDVKFEPAPVQYSKPYFTNDWSAMLIDYRADSFGARFTMVNSDRQHAVVHGEDNLTFPGVDGDPINQQMLVYGRALVIGEDEEVVNRNEMQIKARGEITTEISSQWIQTKQAADALGKWINAHWSRNCDQLQVEVFGNPLIEVGDLVAIEFPAKSMTVASHQYFVTGTSTRFNQGLTTSLTLHRKN